MWREGTQKGVAAKASHLLESLEEWAENPTLSSCRNGELLEVLAQEGPIRSSHGPSWCRSRKWIFREPSQRQGASSNPNKA